MYDESDAILLEENDNFTLSHVLVGPAIAVFVGLEMITGLVINLTVLAIILCHPKPRANWRQPSNIFLTSMLFVNLTAEIFVLPFVMIATASEEWIFGNTVQEKVASCYFAAYMYWYNVLLLMVTLAIVSVDRFLFIVKPNFYRRFVTTGVAIFIVIMSWLVSAVINLTPFMGLGKFAYAESPGSCFPEWTDQRAYLLYFLLIFAFILIIIIVTSIWTFCFTRGFLKRARKLDTRTEGNNEQTNIYNSRWRKLIGIFGTLSIVYALSFMPPLIYLFIRVAIHVPLQVPPVVLTTFYLITVLSPLVQSFFRKDIKDALSDILKKIRHCLRCHSKSGSNDAKKRTMSTFTVQISMSSLQDI